MSVTEFYKTKIYKDVDGYTVAEGQDGEILSESNTAPETPIQAALDRKGMIFLSEGTYDLGSGFAGLTIKTSTTLVSSWATQLRVPNAYTGSVIMVDPLAANDNVTDISMLGGLKLTEQGSAACNWTGLHYKLNSNTGKGITHCHLGNCRVSNSKTAMCIEIIDAGSWISSVDCKQLIVYNSRNGINFLNTVNDSTPFVSAMRFSDMVMQGSAIAEYGIKGITGNNHVYDNIAIWDLHLSSVGAGSGADAHSAEFLAGATNMTVIGGLFTNYNLVNNADKGQVRFLDSYGPNKVWQYIKETYSTAGDGFTKSFTIAHGMPLTPDDVYVTAASKDAIGNFYWTKDATNIYVTYISKAPPPATAGNTNNVSFEWRVSVR